MLGYLGIVVVLLLLTAFFAMAELAMVSARPPRLEVMAAEGSRGARIALDLMQDPGRFLSSLQVGITLTGIFIGAFCGVTLAHPLSELLSAIPWLSSVAFPLAMALVVTAMTYLSLVVGELVPKQVALNNPEQVAAFVSRPVRILVNFSSPVIWLLEKSTRATLKLLRSEQAPPEQVSEEEVKAVIAEGTKAGVLHPEEQKMMTGVMRFADRKVRTLMTARHEVDWIDIEDDPEVIKTKLRETPHSRLPVGRGSLEGISGLVQAKDVLDDLLDGKPIDLAAHIHPFDVLQDSAPALTVIDVLRKSRIQMVLVVDEYGKVEGLVTAADVLGAIIGAMAEEKSEMPGMVQRDDGSWLIDADIPIDELAGTLEAPELTEDQGYSTLAGFVLTALGHLPKTGEHFMWRDWRFEVVDMDGHRIDKMLVSRPGAQVPVELPTR